MCSTSLCHRDDHQQPNVIARYKETIVKIADKEQEADRTVAVQKLNDNIFSYNE
jgi:hypothetical protein